MVFCLFLFSLSVNAMPPPDCEQSLKQQLRCIEKLLQIYLQRLVCVELVVSYCASNSPFRLFVTVTLGKSTILLNVYITFHRIVSFFCFME